MVLFLRSVLCVKDKAPEQEPGSVVPIAGSHAAPAWLGYTESQICFGNPCFSWGAWQTRGTCTSACTRGRSRQCQDGNNQLADSQFCGGGLGDRGERGSCIGGTCLPTIPGPWISCGPWQPWSYCSEFCGSGRRFRERACYYRDGTNSPLPPSVCACTYPQDPEYREEEDCFILTCK